VQKPSLLAIPLKEPWKGIFPPIFSLAKNLDKLVS